LTNNIGEQEQAFKIISGIEAPQLARFFVSAQNKAIPEHRYTELA